MNTHRFVMPYEPPQFGTALSDLGPFDPRCLECGKWPTDCECNSLTAWPVPDEDSDR